MSKKGLYLLVIALILAVIGLGIFIISSKKDDEDDNKKTTENTSLQSEIQEQEQESANNTLKEYQDNTVEDDYIIKEVGEVVELATIKFVVKDFEEVDQVTSWGDSVTKAKEGAKFVVVYLDITNITKVSFELELGDGFPLIDSEDRVYKQYDDVIGSVDNYFNYRELGPDITESGVFLYEVPEDSTGYGIGVGKSGTDEFYMVNLSK